MTTSTMLLSAPAQVRAQESTYRPHQVTAEVSTLAIGRTLVSRDDSHYGENQVWAAPGLGVSYRYRVAKHLAIGAGLEYQAIVGSPSFSSATNRTFHVTRLDLALALVVPLTADLQLESAAGVGPDRVIFEGGWGDFNGPGVHAALRNTFAYALDEDLGFSTGFVAAIGRSKNQKSGDQSYMGDALAFYYVASLHLGVVWWFA